MLPTFGYVFNPISVYYVRDANDEPGLAARLGGEQYALVSKRFTASQRQRYTYEDIKKMHVSPFQPMGQTYTWTAPFPSSNVSLSGRRYEK